MSETVWGDEPSGRRLLTPAEAAARLNVPLTLLRDLRFHRKGPPYIRAGYRTVRYPASGLERWLEQRLNT